jgi:outer membrane murein-binding lipoprotein Lpp
MTTASAPSRHVLLCCARTLLLLRLACGCGLASGCVLASGCSSSATVDARTTTVGQELQDLDAAYDKGLLTEDEYKKKRKQILDSK